MQCQCQSNNRHPAAAEPGMSIYLSHTLLPNHRNYAGYHGQVGVTHKRFLRPDAKINRHYPHGTNPAIVHRRMPFCRSAEEVLELSEESVEEVLQVNQPIPTEMLKSRSLHALCTGEKVVANSPSSRDTICPIDFQDSRQELMQLFDESVGMTGETYWSSCASCANASCQYGQQDTHTMLVSNSPI